MTLRGFSLLAGWLLGGFTILGFLLRWWSGDHFLVARVFNYFMPWMLVLLLPFLIFSIAWHRWPLAALLVVPTAAILVTYAPLFSPVWQVRLNPPLKPSAPVLKIMSYNVWSHNGEVAEMVRVIAGFDPDLLLLQEIPAARFPALQQAVAASRGGEALYAAFEPKLLQGVISRYPLVPLKAMRQLGQAQKVAVDTPAGRITVFNVHPLRRGGWQRRQFQIGSLLEEEILAIAGPVILAGDFNTTDQTQLYRRLSRHLRNAHWEAGFGFGFTYPSSRARFGWLRLPPLVRIDHIFYNGHFQALSAGTVGDSGGSDHYPVTARLAFVTIDELKRR